VASSPLITSSRDGCVPRLPRHLCSTLLQKPQALLTLATTTSVLTSFFKARSLLTRTQLTPRSTTSICLPLHPTSPGPTVSRSLHHSPSSRSKTSRSTKLTSSLAPTADVATLPLLLRSSRMPQRRTVARSRRSPLVSTFTSLPPLSPSRQPLRSRVTGKLLSKLVPKNFPRAVDHVLVSVLDYSSLVRSVSRLPTVTSRVAWAALMPRHTSHHPRSLLPAL
jgi:hypothetical protein